MFVVGNILVKKLEYILLGLVSKKSLVFSLYKFKNQLPLIRFLAKYVIQRMSQVALNLI